VTFQAINAMIAASAMPPATATPMTVDFLNPPPSLSSGLLVELDEGEVEVLLGVELSDVGSDVVPEGGGVVVPPPTGGGGGGGACVAVVLGGVVVPAGGVVGGGG